MGVDVPRRTRWAAYSGRTTTDKLLAVTMPIALFVATGFEIGVLYWTIFHFLPTRKTRQKRD